MTDSALLTRLSRLNSGVVADVLDECGYPHQALSSAIRPLRPDMRLAGRAMCFSGETIASDRDGDAALSSCDIDERLGPGVVGVIATNGHHASAVLGRLMSLRFAKLGCAGIVTDGGARDASGIAQVGLPAFARYVTPLRSKGRWQLTDADATVDVAGQTVEYVTVRSGDYVIGDEDGVMVIPSEIGPQVIEWAEELVRIDARIVAALDAGDSRDKAFASHPRYAHIRRLR
ncbi:MAG TPA: RraA family protein [Casimicrobiaceae bacterium]|nr:RraA family protein [Casimicrobiaceae bacterium]